ncbi:hypothetical protein D6783_04640 [Candidatus Woesearchaeota archaeon]|nr:MAG: hypothetical protein D6783_04640 [Candidatus Woesearchaeota archaeon]
MALTKKKENQLRKMPLIETQLRKSKDGKYLIHRTSITHIRPITYYQAILDNQETLDIDDINIQPGTDLLT